MLRVSGILFDLLTDTLRWLRLAFRSSQTIQAENLLLRRQLALYIERGVKPRRIDAATRIALTVLSRLFDWRDALAIVRPETLIRCHRAGSGNFSLRSISRKRGSARSGSRKLSVF